MQNVRHFVIMGVLVVAMSFGVYYGLNASGLYPVEASAQAIQVDWLMNLHMELISFFFSLIVVPLLYSLVVFHRRNGDTSDGQYFEGNTALEITWTIIPLVIVLGLGYIGAQNLTEINAADPDALSIQVIAYQWAWKFQYPEGFTSTDLYLPIDKQVNFELTSQDVIHSFWVPEFRIKHDVIPGTTEYLRITPIRLGSYKLRCAEICGVGHSYMIANVYVVSQADYDAWVAQQVQAAKTAATVPDPTRGQQFYQTGGCKACHSIDGSPGVGPTWKGLYGSQVKLTDGTTVSADDAYLVESIKSPNAKIVAGFSANVMPKFGSILSDSQIADLVAYIKTLK